MPGKPDISGLKEKKPLSNILRTAGAVPHASRNVILALLLFILEQT